MDWTTIAMLLVAGFFGGGLSALVGGASIVTFPTLLATGMSPISASVAGLVALVPAILLAAAHDRSQLPALDRGFWVMVATSSAGAMLGGALLLLTPSRVFEVMIPLLLGFATIL
ncbi:MAG TPA: TSUP family transporter, partial [Xanthobacteraceae bacterium]